MHGRHPASGRFVIDLPVHKVYAGRRGTAAVGALPGSAQARDFRVANYRGGTDCGRDDRAATSPARACRTIQKVSQS